MTDLRKTSAKLEIAGEVAGRIYVRDRRGKLAAELFKPKGAGVVLLALEPGNYSVTIDDGRNLHRADVEVRSNKTETLEIDGLEDIAIEGTRTRGDPVAPVDRGALPSPPPGGYAHMPFNIGVAPGAELNAAFGRRKVHNVFSISLGATGAAAIDGMQVALGAVWATDYVRGIQGSLGASISYGPSRGIQTALGAAVTRADVHGLQAALVSHSGGTMSGLQFGYGFNYAERLRGVQLGLVNVAGDSKGAQVGLVDITKGEVKGIQVGLVTYADEADAALALIPITRKGGVWVDLWTSDVHLLHAALRFRTRRTYSFLTGGIHPIGGDNSRAFSGGLGFGGPLVWRQRFSVELDNAVSAVFRGIGGVDRSPYLLDTLRLSVAYRPIRHFAIWGAVTLNVMFDFEPVAGDSFRPGYGWSFGVGDIVAQTLNPGVRTWPGFAFGFQF